MDIRSYNRDAWNREVEGGKSPWSQPVSPEIIAKARQGEFSIVLTENIPVPHKWFPPLQGAEVLCLASGGGQQGPVLAATGARVTALDNSPAQLKQDQLVAERELLPLRTVEGDAANLSAFADESFDLVFNPVSTVFMPDVPRGLEGMFACASPGRDFDDRLHESRALYFRSVQSRRRRPRS